MCFQLRILLFMLLGLGLTADSAPAHFLWLVVDGSEGQRQVHVYFSETAAPDDPDLLDRITGAKVWQLTPDGRTRELATRKGDESLVADPTVAANSPTLFGLDHTYGVITRGDETFLLKYYAKTSQTADAAVWQKFDTSERLPLDVAPRRNGQEVELRVLWQGQPLPQAQVVISGPELDEPIEGQTDARGRFTAELPERGLYSIRARHIEPKAGELDGKPYSAVRHYSTLALPID